MAIPETNVPDMLDMMVLRPVDVFHEIQIFSIKDMDEAKALAVLPRSENVKEAIRLFDELSPQLKGGLGASALRQPATREKLQAILKLAPNHVSAQCLLTESMGQRPVKLSLQGSLNEIFSSSSYFLPTIFSKLARDADPDYVTVSNFSPEVYRGTLEKLNNLNFKVDAKTNNILNTMYDFVNLWKAIAEAPRGKAKGMKGELLEARAKVLDELAHLQYDKEAIDEIIRGN
ncbi:MAG: hypothetical protein HC904_07110 [Blastochloris sp.]|nr:hypothetical protein [Blastochloris sp.]